jgi:hypothetical protein
MIMIDRDVANRIRKIMDLQGELNALRATVPLDCRVLLDLTMPPDNDVTVLRGEERSGDELNQMIEECAQ